MNKHRQCPHCKSKKGFRIDYQINGYGDELRDFNGNVLDADRNMVDGHEDATCLSCGRKIDESRLEY